MEKHIKLIREYSAKSYTKMTRTPSGQLKHQFIVPGSVYDHDLWDWDSWLTDVAVRQILSDNGKSTSDFFEYAKGCVYNFLENMLPDGKMYISITPDNTIPHFEEGNPTNIHKPCLAQHIAFIVKENTEDADWIIPYFEKLETFISYYMTHNRHSETGLYYWTDDAAIGVDNDPCTFYRPKNSSASIYLNCLMYKELEAMEYICQRLKKDDVIYKNERQNLKDAINTHLWDERNGFYYSADINLLPIDPDEWLHSGMPRHWDCLIQRIDVWSGAMALWAGIASKEQAEKVLKILTNSELFWCNAGIRTLSPYEKMYKLVKSGNPSCWLGPVWGISNYICFKGLVNYGFDDVAKELCEKTITLFGKDLENHGQFHEYYHPETCEGINNPGFQSWNFLVNNMIAWLENSKTISEF